MECPKGTRPYIIEKENSVELDKVQNGFFQHLSRQFIFQLVLRNKFQPWNLLFNVRRPLLKSNEKRTFISMSTNINLKNSRCLFFSLLKAEQV